MTETKTPLTISNRGIKVATLPVEGKPDQRITVRVSFNEGGINYWDYSRSAKGIYLHVKPVTLDGPFEVFTMGSGLTMILETATRYNAKRLTTLAEGIMESEELKTILAALEIKMATEAAKIEAAFA